MAVVPCRTPATPPEARKEPEEPHMPYSFLLLTPSPPSVHLADARGNPSGGLRMSLADGTVERTDAEPQEAHPALTTEDFMTVAAHLLTQHRRQGSPPGEICRVFG
ncbi:hypothetical protein CLM85_24705 [Streptomyces albidoflavus]|uniref:Uncharacterized protein n=1 Tax=Streptomyces fungicidicus TaxID=68203 RepID=A0ACC7Y7W4_9ACTN|nr:hypothetical protein [Streptomyces fungicidicus]PAX85438.1 hypothetical protein CLM81_12965 [Streptomyces albidoflavus]PAX89848.1 hypothetical protein CLM82_18830 [Streptomyces albidoflavus]PBO16137.1 hypothetical protein CLM83_25655 [Streptomyces albidoflavus]PBO21978.1 hypothetical protein CLM85_24705 [Streptomyces albidoflavus]